MRRALGFLYALLLLTAAWWYFLGEPATHQTPAAVPDPIYGGTEGYAARRARLAGRYAQVQP